MVLSLQISGKKKNRTGGDGDDAADVGRGGGDSRGGNMSKGALVGPSRSRISLYLLGLGILFGISFWREVIVTTLQIRDGLMMKLQYDDTRMTANHNHHHHQHAYPFTFGACLLVKDDNQILPEWLAYHYTVMPLRHLIVAVDPTSRTNPIPIFDDYKETLGMSIQVWTNQSTYWYDGSREAIFANYDPDNYTYTDKWAMHNQRQMSFYTTCLQHFRKHQTQNNISWVLLSDSDEYFTFNPRFAAESSADVGPIRSSVPKKIGKQNETIAHYIASNDAFRESTRNTLCRVFPRINFLALKEVDAGLLQQSVPSSLFDPKCFHTLRYRSHGILRIRKFPGKALVNVQNYNGVKKVQNPHRPFVNSCDNSVFGSVMDQDKPFRTQHYTGSMETFVSRPEREESQWYYRNNVTIEGDDDSLSAWFHEFVRLVGDPKTAKRLTQQHRERAYEESMDIKRRVEIFNETVPAAFDWYARR